MEKEKTIVRALMRVGVPHQGVLFVHSAFKALARSGHDADKTVGALVEYMGDGTLLMPTMSWRYVKPDAPFFDELETPSNTGVLTEVFRIHYATHRSLHPTHSVSGCGRQAEEILSAHHIGDTPCSALSPFGKMVESDAWVLMMGIGMDCCTLLHHAEELVAPDLYLRPQGEVEEYICRARDGREEKVQLRRHLFLPRNYWQFQDMLAAQGKVLLDVVDGVVFRMFRARDIMDAALDALQREPGRIIVGPEQRYRMM